MRTIEADELARILELHALWIYGAEGGVRANLIRADLTDANLIRANLTRANLTRANLTGANLTRANLIDANLIDANLIDANLISIRDDLWAVLSVTPAEVEGLRQALLDGRVNGSTYQGECACLVGTLANVRQCDYRAMPTLKPNASRAAERFFLAIRKGDTPETSQFSRLAVEWVDAWLGSMRTAFGAKAN
jgi:hypothetical protein